MQLIINKRKPKQTKPGDFVLTLKSPEDTIGIAMFGKTRVTIDISKLKARGAITQELLEKTKRLYIQMA